MATALDNARALISAVRSLHRPIVKATGVPLAAQCCASCGETWPCHEARLVSAYEVIQKTAEVEPPIVVELAPDDMRDLYPDLVAAYDSRQMVRVATTEDGVKLRIGRDMWTRPVGRVVSR